MDFHSSDLVLSKGINLVRILEDTVGKANWSTNTYEQTTRIARLGTGDRINSATDRVFDMLLDFGTTGRQGERGGAEKVIREWEFPSWGTGVEHGDANGGKDTLLNHGSEQW